jgi:hypothetical protein
MKEFWIWPPDGLESLSMIELSVTQEEMKRAAQLAANVRLENVFLTGIQVINSMPRLVGEGSINLKANVSHRCLGHKILADKAIFVEVGARVELRIASENKDSDVDKGPAAIADVTYGVLYRLPPPPIPGSITEDVFAAFARVNGLYNCWPYLRQEIQHLTGAMGTPFVLPTLRVTSKPASKEPEIPTPTGTLPILSAAKTGKKRNRKRGKA